MSRNGLDLLKIQTCFLKVHMHCQGCQKKVKKLLQKIEGVYSVNIDAEQQLVIVSGSVDSATLIKKLIRSGKHAELWSPSSDQKLNHGQAIFSRDDKDRTNGINPFKTRQMFPTFLGSDVQDHWSLENYLNQNIRMKPMGGEKDQNLMTASKVENSHMGDYEHIFAMGNDMKSMMVPATFQDFSARRPAYEYEHPPPMMMSNMQQQYHYNHPSAEMMHTNNSIMANHNYMHQPHMMNYKSSIIPPYNDFGFRSAPYPFY